MGTPALVCSGAVGIPAFLGLHMKQCPWASRFTSDLSVNCAVGCEINMKLSKALDTVLSICKVFSEERPLSVF